MGHGGQSYELIAGSADVGFVTPHNAAQVADIVGEIRALQWAAGRSRETLHIFGDVVVFLDDTPQAAQARRRRLDDLAGHEYRSDAEIFVGTPAQLADLLQERHADGLSGFRLRPAALPHDLVQITQGVVPELRRRGLFRTAYQADTLRGSLGLAHPANRYSGRLSYQRPRNFQMSKPIKQIHLAAHFPGVNNTTVWSDPAAGSHIEFSSFAQFAQTAERGKFDFLFLAEGLRLREQNGEIYDLDVVGRPDTFTVLAALAAVTERLGLTGTINSTFNEPYEVARQFASLDHLSGGPRRLERGDLLGCVHRRELSPRRVPGGGSALRAGKDIPADGTGALRLLARRRDRGRQGDGCVPVRSARRRIRHTGMRISTSTAGSTCREVPRVGR